MKADHMKVRSNVVRAFARWQLSCITWVALGVILAGLILATMDRAQRQANDVVCRAHLRQLALALSRYHEFYGSFPPAHISDENGQPKHSWRVLLLPFLESQELYDQYDFSQSWNRAGNRALAETRIPGIPYGCPEEGSRGGHYGNYVAVCGPKATWAGGSPVRRTKSMGDKILLIETQRPGILWLEPRDVSVDEAVTALKTAPAHGVTSNVVTVRGDVLTISKDEDETVLRKMLLRDDVDQAPAEVPEEEIAERIKLLKRCLGDSSRYWRVHAAQELGRLGPKARNAVGSLRGMLNDRDQEMRIVAEGALREIEGERPDLKRKR